MNNLSANKIQKDLYAGIDVGSNTIRLIIGYFDNEKLYPIEKILKITRLGKDFHKSGIIAEESRKASLETLVEFSRIIRGYNVKGVLACATGVLRKAINSGEFVGDVFEKTGLKINIISGDKEALLTARGVRNAVKSNLPHNLIFDVGGGSTEFIFYDNDVIEVAKSVDIGAVTLFESYIKGNIPKVSELKLMNDHIKKVVSELNDKYFKTRLSLIGNNFDLIFTAGTATTLAAIKLKMEKYEPERVNNCALTRDEVSAFYNVFITTNKSEREKIIGLEKGRADIIISGAAIALNVMDIFVSDKVIISDGGLLEGIIMDCYDSERKAI